MVLGRIYKFLILIKSFDPYISNPVFFIGTMNILWITEYVIFVISCYCRNLYSHCKFFLSFVMVQLFYTFFCLHFYHEEVIEFFFFITFSVNIFVLLLDINIFFLLFFSFFSYFPYFAHQDEQWQGKVICRLIRFFKLTELVAYNKQQQQQQKNDSTLRHKNWGAK